MSLPSFESGLKGSKMGYKKQMSKTWEIKCEKHEMGMQVEVGLEMLKNVQLDI